MTQTANDIDVSADLTEQDLATYLSRNFSIIRALLQNGVDVSGTFTTTDGKTITVEHGIVQSII